MLRRPAGGRHCFCGKTRPRQSIGDPNPGRGRRESRRDDRHGRRRGIGAATARLAAARGYAVCVNYLSRRDAADAVVAEITGAGGRAVAIAGDVAKEADVARLFDGAQARLGAISALVNNAGILERQTRLDDMEAERFERVFATNITGAFLCAREAVRRMSTRHGGKAAAS
jgi:NAD(P)-dependent dehydrogenase (short-subunit alcohol dehydrogenase family)